MQAVSVAHFAVTSLFQVDLDTVIIIRQFKGNAVGNILHVYDVGKGVEE